MLLLNPKIEIGLNVGLRSNSIETLPPPPNSQKKFYSLRLCYHNYAIRQKSQNRIAWLQAAVAALVVARHIIFSVATLKKSKTLDGPLKKPQVKFVQILRRIRNF